MRLFAMSVLAATALLFSSVRPAAACDDDDDAIEARFAGFDARINALNERIGAFGDDDDDDEDDDDDDDRWDTDDDDDDDDDDVVVDFDFGFSFVEIY